MEDLHGHGERLSACPGQHESRYGYVQGDELMPIWFPELVGYPDDPEIAADIWEEYQRDMAEMREKGEI